MSKCCNVLPCHYQHWGPKMERYLSSCIYSYSSLYNECRANPSDVFNAKFADDTVIGDLITEDETKYCGCVDKFVDWCHASFLQLHTKKTKEMIFDFKACRRTHQQVAINGDCITYTHIQ